MSVPATGQLEALATEALPAAPPDNGLTLLVIEDDPGRRLTVPEMLDTDGQAGSASAPPATSPRPSGCSPTTSTASCSTSRCPARPHEDGRRRARRAARTCCGSRPATPSSRSPPCGDAERGAEAVRVGAQDYLFRDELDGRLLSRAIRYAVERKRVRPRPAPAHRVPAARPGERPAGARAAAHPAAGGLRAALRRPLPARPLPRPARRRLLRHGPHARTAPCTR